MVRLESKLSLAVTTSGSKMWLADLLAHKKLLKVYSPNTFSPNSELTKLLQATKLKTCRCTSNPNFLAPNYLTWACSISTFQNTSSHPKVLNEPPNFHHTITPSTMDSSLLVDFMEGGEGEGCPTPRARDDGLGTTKSLRKKPLVSLDHGMLSMCPKQSIVTVSILSAPRSGMLRCTVHTKRTCSLPAQA